MPTTGVWVSVHRRRALGEGHQGGREQGPTPVQGPRNLVGVLEEAWPEPRTRAAGPRRPGRAGLHRHGPERDVADGHHRAPHRRRKALPLRGEGRLLRKDRRLLDGRPDEVLACRRRTGQCGAGTPPGRDSGALGSRVPVPVPPFRRITPAPRPDRIDGQGRCVCRQRCDGIVLLAPAEERPGPSAVAHQAGPPPGHHNLDRENLPPPATAKTARQTHAHRI